jgi:SAM-dependent methyltransferase
MTQEILTQHLRLWKTKPVLRAIYHDYYNRMGAALVPGRTLEVGGGSGNFKEFRPELISTDLIAMPGLDCVCDAQQLPFAARSFANLVGIDILHHLENPRYFLQEAERVLQGGGRLVFLEPAVTPVRFLFYKLFHPEPVDLSANPFADVAPDPERKPFDANQAIPELVFGKYQKRLKALCPSLTVMQKKYLSLWAYPLSGGFREWSMIPPPLVKPLLKMERILEPVLGRILGFKILIVLTKQAQPNL